MNNPFASSRLIYRAAEFPEDTDFFFTIESDPVAAANSDTTLHKPRTKKDVEQQYKNMSEDELLHVVICLPTFASTSENSSHDAAKDSNLAEAASIKSPSKPIPIGQLSLSGASRSTRHHRHGMIGINILEPYQGKGYGTEAIEWVLRWAFRIAGLHRIEIGCFSYNGGARKLYERMGFVFECRKREWLWYEGGWHDLIEFSMLEHEWRETRGKATQSSGVRPLSS